MSISEVLTRKPAKDIPSPKDPLSNLKFIPGFMNPETRLAGIQDFIEEHKRFGEPAIAQANVFGQRIVMVGDGKLGHEILKNSSMERASMQTNMSIVLGETILTTEGYKWKKKRSMVNKFINKNSGELYFDDINTTMDQELDTWEKKIKSGDFLIKREVNGLMQRVVQSTILAGFTIPDQLNEKTVGLIEKGYKYALMPQLSLFDKEFQKDKKEVYGQLTTYFESIKDKALQKEGLLKSLLTESKDEEGNVLEAYTMEEAAGEFISIYTAAWETTANTVLWSLGEISLKPDYLENLHLEATDKLTSKVLASDKKPDSSTKISELLPMASAAFEYGLMMYPQSPIGLRQATKDIEIGGYKFKKGSMVLVSIEMINKDREVLGENYNLETSGLSELPDHLPLSFSAGSHKCPGGPIAELEGPLLISKIAERFKIWALGNLPKPVPGTTMPPPDNFYLGIAVR